MILHSTLDNVEVKTVVTSEKPGITSYTIRGVENGIQVDSESYQEIQSQNPANPTDFGFCCQNQRGGFLKAEGTNIASSNQKKTAGSKNVESKTTESVAILKIWDPSISCSIRCKTEKNIIPQPTQSNLLFKQNSKTQNSKTVNCKVCHTIEFRDESVISDHLQRQQLLGHVDFRGLEDFD